MLELNLGSLFAHRFVIEKRIQAGGMGLVFRARDRQTNRPVALKLLQREANTGEVDRFMREARTLSELRHPGIVGYVAHGISSEGQPYLVMEWLEGEDLSQRLRRLRTSIPEVLILLRAVAESLQVAHQAGVLHRDIKPSNLFLREGQLDRVTLIDFGLARRALGGGHLTQTGVVVGTPEYMAPEQARGDRQIGPSADIFSLGCVAYECLTGQPPFVSEHIAAVLAKILFEEAPPLNIARPDAPEALTKLVGRMLAKNPLSRIADATALLAELAAVGELPNDQDPSLSSASTGSLRFEMIGTEQVLVSVVIAQSRNPERSDRATLDPASLKAAQSHSDSLRETLLQFGVTVESMVDGSIIATITRQGAPTDQAAQAARCALIIKDRWPDSIVALATGRAVLEGEAMFGEVLGRIGKMLESAQDNPNLPAGAVIADSITSRLVESHFSISRVGNLNLLMSGVGQPADETRPLLGVPTQCVGRERELNLLDASLASCSDNGTPAVVLVSAPPGAGKSRLRHEFVRRVNAQHADVLILMGRGDPMSVGASYGLLSQALRGMSGIADGEDIRVRQDKLRDRVSKCVEPGEVQRVAEFLGEMCGTSFPDSTLLRAARQDPRVMSDQVAQAFIDFLTAECIKRPVLLLLEDLHWGDVLTVKLVDLALRDLGDQPFMVLALARPEVEDLFPKLWADRARQDIRLGALPKRACERLVQQVLGKKISSEVQARIIEQAAGNALFLEELMRAVAEGKGDELPETVLAILHARLMRLSPEARRVLRTASVFGETFWEGGVRRLLGRERAGEQLESWLQILVDSEIIERRKESRFPGEKEYTFRHGLVREAAYGMLPDDERNLGHYLVGCYLEGVGETDSMVLAEHFQRSGDLERAIVLYTRAAEKAYESNDLEGALRRADKGLNCGAEGESRGALFGLQAAAWFWRNDLESAFRIGNDALALLTSGTVDWCRTMCYTTGAAAALGKREQISSLALRFASITPASEILGTYIASISLFATLLAFVGDRDMSGLFLAHLKEIAEPIEEKDLHARGWMHYALGRCTGVQEPQPFSAVQHFRRSSAAFPQIGDRRMIAVATADLGFSLARIGQRVEGEAKLREVLPLALRLDEPITLTWIQMYLALLLAERGDKAGRDEGKQLAQTILRNIGEASYYSGIAFCALSAAYRVEGELVQAEEAARKAMETMRWIPSNAPLAFTALTRVLLASGRTEEAVQTASTGMESVLALKGTGSSELPLRLAHIEALRAHGDQAGCERAQEELRQQIELRLKDTTDPSLRASYLARVESRDGSVPLF